MPPTSPSRSGCLTGTPPIRGVMEILDGKSEAIWPCAFSNFIMISNYPARDVSSSSSSLWIEVYKVEGGNWVMIYSKYNDVKDLSLGRLGSWGIFLGKVWDGNRRIVDSIFAMEDVWKMVESSLRLEKLVLRIWKWMWMPNRQPNAVAKESTLVCDIFGDLNLLCKRVAK